MQTNVMIRKRRPTPASLVIMTDSPPEIDEKRMNNNSQEESQNATPKQRKQSVYTPPAMKGTVQISFLSPPSQPSHVIGSRVKSRQSGQRI
ncbi:protein phosphatase 1 regulatory subunit 1C isoform X5 [Hemicordylus capensis]|uniref:protein phosphatase 1 regulatory subunit 1C isoform X5 n=1 Tax=Hemicordylus capensis TaxID=884348 RepID=UPI002302DBC0|nr:protein phosphatase 1 regulatory subunit 1C isoform X5 [Hemicordylus capensis]